MNLRYTQECDLLQECTERKLLRLIHLSDRKIETEQVIHTHKLIHIHSLKLMRCFV